MMKMEQWDVQQAAYGKPDGFTDRSLKGRWFCFDGGLNRMRFFIRALPVWLLMGAVWAVAQHVFWLYVVYLPLLWSLLSLVSRRAHDLGRGEWPVIIGTFIPVVNFFLSLYLLFAQGTAGPNEYGLDPLEYPYDV